MKFFRLRSFLPCLLLPSLPLAAADYHAAFNTAFSGSPPASATTPWIDLTFVTLSPGNVQLTVSNLNLTGSENIDELYINLNPADNPLSLHISEVGSIGAFTAPTISTGINQFKADGDGKYDVIFRFAVSGSDANRFNNSESARFNISGITGLTAADFVYLSAPAGGSGPFYAAAHIQRIGCDESDSGWVSVVGMTDISHQIPEPSVATFIILFAPALVWLIKHQRLQRLAVRPIRVRAQRNRPPPGQ